MKDSYEPSGALAPESGTDAATLALGGARRADGSAFTGNVVGGFAGGSALRLPAALVPRLALIAGDLAAFAGAWSALHLAGLAAPATWRLGAALAFGGVAMFATAGFYPGYFRHSHDLLRRRWLAGARLAGAAAAVALIYGSIPLAGLSLAIVGMALALQSPLRAAVRGGLSRLGLWGLRGRVFADPDSIPGIAAYFNEHPELGVDCGERGPARRTVGDRRRHADRAAVALVAAPFPDDAALAGLRQRFGETILLADLPCLPASGLHPRDVDGAVGLRLGSGPSEAADGLVFRLVDVPISLVAIAISAPFMLAAAAAIWHLDPGPVLYRQTREGRGGRTFRVLKLRTMYQDADARLEALLQSDPAARAEWETHYKLRHDPRILPVVGDFLRRSSVDELPQFFNVLAGDMRVVGPRPFPLYHLAAMAPDFREKRRGVTPGLTGFWQVSERSGATIERQQRLDEFYIENRCFWFDLDILLATFSAVLRRKGAY